MLSLEDCKKFIKSPQTDEEILQMRDQLYGFVNILLDSYPHRDKNKTKSIPIQTKAAQ